MKTLGTEFDICRLYILDLQPVLGRDLFNKISGYLRARDVEALAKTGELFDSTLYPVEVFRALHQIQAFFRKSDSFADEVACYDAAVKSFREGERRCRITNKRLTYYYLERDRLDPDLQLKLERMRTYIRRVLGSFDHFFGDLPRRMRFTSGATATQSRRNSHPHQKVSMRVECPKSAFPIIRSLYLHYGYNEPKFREVNWNRVEAVPKSWKTHRLIACEPGHLVPLQLAVDGYLKRRLAKFGIDLRNQRRNRDLAREGSITGNLATIDLQGASDSLSLDLVHLLFPEEWIDYLMRTRSEFYRFDGKIGKYAKFSSMGNGMTFVLETLVFSACCFAIRSERFSVYGDDIIIETEKARELIALLRFVGFRTNEDKSFYEGSFRESCGGDFYEGKEVTPFYIRTMKSELTNFHHLVNGLVGICLPGGLLWNHLIDIVKENNSHLIPYNDVSTSGIFIDDTSAYSLKLIKMRRSVPRYVVYLHLQEGRYHEVDLASPKPHHTYIGNSRTLFLWYLDKYWRPDSDPVERSWEPSFDTRVVRKRVSWRPPAKVTPIHLFWWSEDLLRALGHRGYDPR